MDVDLLIGIFPQVLLDGIILGFMSALIALGYPIVYGVLEFINFAHSEIFIFGAFVGVEVMLGLKGIGLLDALPWPLVLLLVLAAGMATSGLVAVTVERVAYRPLRGAPRLVPLISAIGVSFLLTDIVRGFEAITRNLFNFTYPVTDLPALSTPIKLAFGDNTVNVKVTSIIVIIGAVLMLLALNYFVNGTKLGRGIRAVSQDQTTAGLMGINVNRMISLTFFIGGALGGAGGALFGMNVGTVTPYVGFI